jgi:hypothetical protein
MKQKTPLQQLISSLERMAKIATDEKFAFGYNAAKTLAETLLQKEKDVIKASNDRGWQCGRKKINENSEDYYTDNFEI